MKKGLHPPYYETTVRCACGAEYKTKSTKQNLHVEICSRCHPFFTGRQKFVDSGGRIKKFQKKYGISSSTPKKSKKTPPG